MDRDTFALSEGAWAKADQLIKRLTKVCIDLLRPHPLANCHLYPQILRELWLFVGWFSFPMSDLPRALQECLEDPRGQRHRSRPPPTFASSRSAISLARVLPLKISFSVKSIYKRARIQFLSNSASMDPFTCVSTSKRHLKHFSSTAKPIIGRDRSGPPWLIST